MPLVRFWQHKAIEHSVNALVLGSAIAAVGALGAGTETGAEWEEALGLRWLFAVRGPVAPPPEVVVIAIDEQSARELELPENPRAWPRSLHAELSRYLARSGARVVVFDLTFDAAGAQPAHDLEFAEAMRSAGNVLIAESIRRDTIRLEGVDGRPNGSAVIERRNSPLRVLEEAALGSAPFMLPKDARVDMYWTFLDERRTMPTLPVLSYLVFSSEGAVPAKAGEEFSKDPLDPTLLQLYAAPENQYLNFYGPPRTIPTVPYSEVLRAARNADSAGIVGDARFKGRAVFIGYAAATLSGQDRLRDDYRTVFSQANGLDLSGVEIAATAFANLVEGRALQPLGTLRQVTLVVAWGFVLGAICRLIRPIFAVVIVAVLTGAYLWLTQNRFAEAAVWMPSMTLAALQAPLALFAGVWLNYRDTKREREVIKRAFGYFLPRDVVDQLAQSIGAVTDANQVLFGACLATDAEKYTSLAESMEPSRLGALMNEYYAELFVPVERSGGVIADVVGDSMIAVWAKSSPRVDVRRGACLAALEISAAVDRFNISDADRPPLPTSFGLHSGDMLFGSIGASGHFEYRAVGDIVNTASRIQGLNKVLGTRFLASQDTVAGLEDLAIRPLGLFLLAGKAKAVSIVEVLGIRAAMDEGDLKRCERFAVALTAFASRQWLEAAATFEALTSSEESDGPSRFYAAQCRRLLAEPFDPDWSPVIRVASK